MKLIRAVCLTLLLAAAACTPKISDVPPSKDHMKIATVQTRSYLPRYGRAAKVIESRLSDSLKKNAHFDRIDSKSGQEDLWIIVTITDISLGGRTSLDEGAEAVSTEVNAKVDIVRRKDDKFEQINLSGKSNGGIIAAGCTNEAMNDLVAQITDHVNKHYKIKG